MPRINIERSSMVPMRDGVRLATDIYRIDSADTVPTLLSRTPYDKNRALQDGSAANWDVMRAVEAGYAVVVQDVRGRFASGGTFDPHFQEADDGVDAIDWITAQPWSNGRVGMFGGSYLGCSQWMAARARPAALRAIAPSVTPIDMLGDGLFQGGAKALHDLRWAVEAIGPAEMRRRVASGHLPPDTTFDLTLDEALELLPIGDAPLIRQFAPFFDRNLRHREDQAYWEPISPARWLDDIDLPALHIGGWYDAFLWSTLQGYSGLRERAKTVQARASQRLIIGPWSHGNFSGRFPDRDFGPLASAGSLDLMGIQLRWFDAWLRDDPAALEQDSPVTLFLMGEDRWVFAEDWSLGSVLTTDVYLASSGRANSRDGDGFLSFGQPGHGPEDRWLDDPLSPVPSVGGPVILPGFNVDGPVDQRTLEQRHDVLVFTSDVLNEQLTVSGAIDLVLFVSTSGRDGDFTGKLIDVWPDGRAINITEGILRASFRNGPTSPESVEPDTIYELQVSLWATANTFGIGHRIRLEVASSNFPRFARNSHSGKSEVAEGRDAYQPAIHRLHHDAEHPSRLSLPIIQPNSAFPSTVF